MNIGSQFLLGLILGSTFGAFNRKPKDLKRESRGFSDFDYTRNRILWAIRETPNVKGIPRSKEENHYSSLKITFY